MINAKQAKQFIDDAIVKELERVTNIMTIADLGPKAKQTDVSKVKTLIRARIDKIRKVPSAKEVSKEAPE